MLAPMRETPSLLASATPHLRQASLAVTASLFAKPLFRLCLGRWPQPGELAAFRTGLCDQDIPLPPACRAILSAPDASLQISRLALLDMVRDKRIEVHNTLDIAGAVGGLFVPPASGNPLNFWRGPPVAFLHIEKTAGSSLVNLLTDLFHPFQIDPDPQRTAAPHVVEPFADRPAAEIRRHPLIFGHYDLPSLRRLDPSRLIVTMLRDPASRILSSYYYWRSVHPDFVANTTGETTLRIAHRSTLLEFLHHPDPLLRNYLDNLYVRRLTGLYASQTGDALEQAPEAALQTALDGLLGLDFVGITERLSHSVTALAARLGFTPPDELSSTNITETNHLNGARGTFRHVPRETLTDAHRERLAHLTRLDRIVYDTACANLA